MSTLEAQAAQNASARAASLTLSDDRRYRTVAYLGRERTPLAATFLDLRRLRYIVAIADHGSISAAARILNLAQPALTYHLSAIEGQLGQQLFERQSTGVVPTTLGLIFVDHARLILNAAKVAEDDIRRHIASGNAVSKPFRLAIIPSLAGFMSSRIIDMFSAKFPRRTLHLIDARTAFAQELLETGKADAAVSLTVSLDKDDLFLAWERLCVIARDGSEDANQPIPFAKAAKLNLLLPGRGNPLRGFLEAQAAREGIVLNVAMEIDGYEPRRGVVLSGHGATIVGLMSFNDEAARRGLSVRPIVEPELIRPIVLKLRRGIEPTMAEEIRHLLTDAFTEVTEDARRAI